MARTHGKDSNFSYNSVSIEDELNSITMNATVAETDITAFSDTYQTYLAGKKSVTFDVTGALDASFAGGGDATIFDHIALTSGPKTLVYDIDGAGPDTNSPEYTCTSSGLTGAMVSSYSISLPVGDAATYSASFQCSGSTTRVVS
tara:strand:- start:524 stop:958 length:435 start_codon:yes stop_codon:yes gene_type:complete